MSDKTTTFEDIKEIIREFRKARRWSEYDNAKNFAISLMVEAVELLEHFQWREVDEVTAHKQTKEEVVDELADVAYWVVVLADSLKIDLSEAMRNKLKKAGNKYPAKNFSSVEDREKRLKVYYQMRNKVRDKRTSRV